MLRSSEATTQASFGPSPEDRTAAALTKQLGLGSQMVTIQVSPVRQYSDYGPDVDVVQAWVLDEDGNLVALRDLYPTVSTQEAYTLWSLLCEQLTTAAAAPYGLRPEPGINPKLGCWGPRPDLAAAGTDDDSATALMIGVAVHRGGATQTPDPKLLVLAVHSAMVASLRSWAAAARATSPHPATNGA